VFQFRALKSRRFQIKIQPVNLHRATFLQRHVIEPIWLHWPRHALLILLLQSVAAQAEIETKVRKWFATLKIQSLKPSAVNRGQHGVNLWST
jgi:hypothetical protein